MATQRIHFTDAEDAPTPSRRHPASPLKAPSSLRLPGLLSRHCPYARKYTTPTFRRSPLSRLPLTAADALADAADLPLAGEDAKGLKGTESCGGQVADGAGVGQVEDGASLDGPLCGSGSAVAASQAVKQAHVHTAGCTCKASPPRRVRPHRNRPDPVRRLVKKVGVPEDLVGPVRRSQHREHNRRLRLRRRLVRPNQSEAGIFSQRRPDDSAESLLKLEKLRNALLEAHGDECKGLMVTRYAVPGDREVSRAECLLLADEYEYEWEGDADTAGDSTDLDDLEAEIIGSFEDDEEVQNAIVDPEEEAGGEDADADYPDGSDEEFDDDSREMTFEQSSPAHHAQYDVKSMMGSPSMTDGVDASASAFSDPSFYAQLAQSAPFSPFGFGFDAQGYPFYTSAVPASQVDYDVQGQGFAAQQAFVDAGVDASAASFDAFSAANLPAPAFAPSLVDQATAAADSPSGDLLPDFVSFFAKLMNLDSATDSDGNLNPLLVQTLAAIVNPYAPPTACLGLDTAAAVAQQGEVFAQ